MLNNSRRISGPSIPGQFTNHNSEMSFGVSKASEETSQIWSSFTKNIKEDDDNNLISIPNDDLSRRYPDNQRNFYPGSSRRYGRPSSDTSSFKRYTPKSTNSQFSDHSRFSTKSRFSVLNDDNDVVENKNVVENKKTEINEIENLGVSRQINGDENGFIIVKGRRVSRKNLKPYDNRNKTPSRFMRRTNNEVYHSKGNRFQGTRSQSPWSQGTRSQGQRSQGNRSQGTRSTRHFLQKPYENGETRSQSSMSREGIFLRNPNFFGSRTSSTPNSPAQLYPERPTSPFSTKSDITVENTPPIIMKQMVQSQEKFNETIIANSENIEEEDIGDF